MIIFYTYDRYTCWNDFLKQCIEEDAYCADATANNRRGQENYEDALLLPLFASSRFLIEKNLELINETQTFTDNAFLTMQNRKIKIVDKTTRQTWYSKRSAVKF